MYISTDRTKAEALAAFRERERRRARRAATRNNPTADAARQEEVSASLSDMHLNLPPRDIASSPTDVKSDSHIVHSANCAAFSASCLGSGV